MKIRTAATALTAVTLLTLTACDSSDSNSPSKPETASQDTSEKPNADTETSSSETDAAPDTAELPDFTGENLQAAQDAAQAAGFYNLDDQDASGQDRLQVFDRNWVVCSQEPSPGTHPTDTRVILYAVKDGESC
ncbi:PASTA domain-containing protein [Streptomyces massasporeus]|uniref:PASTA domain-containing protein n=1 Tax=Streptomyces massasporeus TaxID=67324 RepID=UPI001E51F0EB|nr:PASTA domain-containing protein [Streptomyces massasporeus]